ncbi:MAG: hypothetical protein JWM11_6262 [Planctomycetaceae bacterium]|nr:hypothetical protein [Planctomycetaceae bacterium]
MQVRSRASTRNSISTSVLKEEDKTRIVKPDQVRSDRLIFLSYSRPIEHQDVEIQRKLRSRVTRIRYADRARADLETGVSENARLEDICRTAGIAHGSNSAGIGSGGLRVACGDVFQIFGPALAGDFVQPGCITKIVANLLPGSHQLFQSGFPTSRVNLQPTQDVGDSIRHGDLAGPNQSTRPVQQLERSGQGNAVQDSGQSVSIRVSTVFDWKEPVTLLNIGARRIGRATQQSLQLVLGRTMFNTGFDRRMRRFLRRRSQSAATGFRSI